MIYSPCTNCGRPVMEYNACSYCQTMNKGTWQKESPGPQGPREPIAHYVVGLAVGGLTFSKTNDLLSGFVAGLVAGYITQTRFGQAVVKIALVALMIGLFWAALQMYR